MPRSHTVKELLKADFFEIAEFSEVLGCIDVTRIPTFVPSVDQCAYVNRKYFYSINFQAM